MQLEISQLDLKYAHLRVNDPSANRMLLASMAACGQQTPVLVVRHQDHEYVLIDGYGRVSALSKLSLDHVQVVVLDVPESEALIQGYRMSQGRRCNALEEGWLLLELMVVHGHKQRDLGRIMGRSASWVSRRLSLVKVLPESVQQAVRRGQVPAQGAMKSLVPLARANESACEQVVQNLVQTLGSGRVSVRQLADLYGSWKLGDADQRENLLRNPTLFLKTAAESRSDQSSPTISDECAALVNDLEILVSVCRRCRSRVRDGVLQRAVISGDFRSLWQELNLVFGSLSRHIQKEAGDVGSRHAHSHFTTIGKRDVDPQDSPYSSDKSQDGPQGSVQWRGVRPIARSAANAASSPADGT